MDLDPTSFTIKEAAERLLPSNVWPGIKTDVPAWQPWSPPPKPQPIDRQVAHQIKRHNDGARAPRMRSREELAAIGIPCPYRHARFATTIAANDGTERARAVRNARATGGAKLKELAKQARTLAEQIDAFLNEYDCWDLYGLNLRPASRRNFDDGNNHISAVNDSFYHVSVAPEAFRALAILASEKKERIAPSNADGDVWGQAFAERMGYAWRDLTGKDPSETSDYFLKFVAAAFDSLGKPEAHEGPWKDQVRTARERVEALPEWDRWDRCERRTDPPGVEVMPSGWFKERQKQRQRQFEAAVFALLDAQTDEVERETRLILLTGWSFLPETEEGQKTIARIRAQRGHLDTAD